MMSTIREVQALKLLYDACPDRTVRARVMRLVPDLALIVDPNDVMIGDPSAVEALLRTLTVNPPRRRRLTARTTDGNPRAPITRLLGTRDVVSDDASLDAHKRALAATFDLAAGRVWVTVEDLE